MSRPAARAHLAALAALAALGAAPLGAQSVRTAPAARPAAAEVPDAVRAAACAPCTVALTRSGARWAIAVDAEPDRGGGMRAVRALRVTPPAAQGLVTLRLPEATTLEAGDEFLVGVTALGRTRVAAETLTDVTTGRGCRLG